LRNMSKAISGRLITLATQNRLIARNKRRKEHLHVRVELHFQLWLSFFFSSLLSCLVLVYASCMYTVIFGTMAIIEKHSRTIDRRAIRRDRVAYVAAQRDIDLVPI